MIVKVTNHVFISTPDDADPNDIGVTFESGADSALSHFPKGQVIQVDVESVERLSNDEIEELGFEDEYE